MRIIGGSAAGVLLKTVKGYEVRPTPDLVKQALFNSLGERVVGARILDLFAGSGALGLECLSRGAGEVVGVELASRHAAFIRTNLVTARLPEDRFALRQQDVFTAVRQLVEAGRCFDLVLADPPYGEKNVGRRSTSPAQQLLDDPSLPDLLDPSGLLVIGHARRDVLSPPSRWEDWKVLRHGDSLMHFFRPATSACA